MRRLFFSLILILVSFNALNSYASNLKKQIGIIYISSEGNNVYEAEIKAHIKGMYRALYLLCDKLGVKQDEISMPPYEVLKKLFSIKVIKDEVRLKEQYSAQVIYEYHLGDFYTILLEYASSEANKLFYEYLIIPVYKQGNKFEIWNYDNKWLKLWQNSKDELKADKLLLTNKSLYLSNKINEKNINSLTYNDFLELYKNKYFKGVMLITAEYFTDRESRNSTIKINNKILRGLQTEPINMEYEFPLLESKDIEYAINEVKNALIKNFGNREEIEFLEEHYKVTPEEEVKISEPILMTFQAMDENELAEITAKIQNIDFIEQFRIEHSFETSYKLHFITSEDMETVAKKFFENNLSYRNVGDSYILINVNGGI